MQQHINGKSRNGKCNCQHLQSATWTKRKVTSDSLWLDGDLEVHPNLIVTVCVYSSSREGRSNEDRPTRNTGQQGCPCSLRREVRAVWQLLAHEPHLEMRLK